MHAYVFDYQLSCWCPARPTDPVPPTEPVRIEVRADTIARVLSLVTGDEVPAASPPINWPTVDSLFQDVERLTEWSGRADWQARYHETFGYPTFVSGFLPDAGPNGFTMVAANLVRLDE